MFYQGKARLFVQSNGKKGAVQIEAISNGLNAGKLLIEAIKNKFFINI
jgi:hypothetical protein